MFVCCLWCMDVLEFKIKLIYTWYYWRALDSLCIRADLCVTANSSSLRHAIIIDLSITANGEWHYLEKASLIRRTSGLLWVATNLCVTADDKVILSGIRVRLSGESKVSSLRQAVGFDLCVTANPRATKSRINPTYPENLKWAASGRPLALISV